MKSMMKLINLSFLLTLLVTACGGGDGLPPSPLRTGGPGLTLGQVATGAGGTVVANFSTALAINDANQVIGVAETTPGATFTAALWTVDAAGAATATPRALLPFAGEPFSAAFAIDQAGKAVGQSAKGARLVAVIWPAGATAPSELPALAAGNSAAFGISPDGALIAGEAQDAALTTRAVIWTADIQGNFTAPPVLLPVNIFAGQGLQSTFSSASGVNRVGAEIWVAGKADDSNGATHAALWRSSGGAVFAAAVMPENAAEAGGAAIAVSSSGQVVGEVEIGGAFAPALWVKDGTGAFIRTNLSATGTAVAVNNVNRAVGSAGAGPAATAWTLPGGAAQSLFTDGVSRAYGTNNGNMVVGVKDNKGFIKKIN